MSREAGIARWEGKKEGLAAAISIINDHIPSLTDEDESGISERLGTDGYGYTVEDENYSGLAIRTCACGKKIDGFYEYVDHLKEVLT